LHNSKYFSSKSIGRECPQSDYYTQNLLRLPLYVGIPKDIAERIAEILEGSEL